MPVSVATKKLQLTKSTSRPPLVPNQNYTVNEAALCVGVAAITVWRAIYSDRLQTYRVGSRVVISGQQLLDWLQAGGKTLSTK